LSSRLRRSLRSRELKADFFVLGLLFDVPLAPAMKRPAFSRLAPPPPSG